MSSRQVDSASPFLESPTGDDDATPSRVGEVLCDKYELVRKIGEGGMGEVYEARHRVLGRRFAVKLLHPELVRSGRMLRRFSRESLSASRIESDHVVSIVDCGHLPDGAPFYVMDYLRGQDLRSVLRVLGQLPVPRAIRLIIQACRGLRVAHELGLVHRDLKPENLFIERTDDGRDRAKILDFGVVQTSGGNSTAQSGSLIGTLKYMAPEQARGDTPLDQRADLYALGAMLYECLAGEVPHPGRNAEAILFHVMNEQPIPLREMRAGLDPNLEAIVKRCLERHPNDRFQSADELANALEQHVDGHTAHVTSGMHLVVDDTAALEHTRSEELSIGPVGYARPAASPKARRRLATSALVLLGAFVLHLSDRAWLLRAFPHDAKIAAPVAVAARQSTPIDPPQAPRTDRPISPAVVRAGSAQSARPVTADRRAPAKVIKVNAARRPDDYSVNLDWQNPYGTSEPQKK
jgi:serine/threonine protein kinase